MEIMDKELLLKDLCARLPYGVKFTTDIKDIWTLDSITSFKENGNIIYCINIINRIDCVKPYLRPISSMTEEEREYLRNIDDFLQIDVTDNTVCGGYKTFDYLNSIYVDYRGLIDKGLALEAPEGIYNSKEK